MQHTSPEGRGHCTAQNTASEGRGHCTAQQIAPRGRGHCTAQHTALHHAGGWGLALCNILHQRAGVIALRKILHQRAGGIALCNILHQRAGVIALRKILHQRAGGIALRNKLHVPEGWGHCMHCATYCMHHAEGSLGVIALHKILRQGALRCATYCTMQRAGGIALRNYILHQGPGAGGSAIPPTPWFNMHCATYCTRGWGHCTAQHIAPGAGGIALRNILHQGLGALHSATYCRAQGHSPKLGYLRYVRLLAIGVRVVKHVEQ